MLSRLQDMTSRDALHRVVPAEPRAKVRELLGDDARVLGSDLGWPAAGTASATRSVTLGADLEQPYALLQIRRRLEDCA
jgi:hypothetical protein